MVGDIKAPRVIIVAGAAFRGRVDMGDMESERAERPRKAPKIEVEDRTTTTSKKKDEKEKPAGNAGMDFGGRKPPAVRAAVAPRAGHAGGAQPAAPAAPASSWGQATL